MSQHLHLSFLFIVFIAISAGTLSTSCSRRDAQGDLWEDIKTYGNTHPVAALQRLDSALLGGKQLTRSDSMRVRLLRLRLRDKAEIVPSSAREAEEVKDYFMRHGSPRQKQEALYYYASTRRDLKDTPAAIEGFLQAYDTGREAPAEVDSALLANTCTQLCALYSFQGKARTALKYADEAISIARQGGFIEAGYLIGGLHAAYGAHEEERAVLCMTQALDDFKNNKKAVRHDPVWLSDIIYYATLLHRQDLAVEAQKLLQTDYVNFLGTGRYHLAMSMYCQRYGTEDSLIVHLSEACRLTDDFADKYNAAYTLVAIYGERKQWEQAAKYAMLMKQASDSIDARRASEGAAQEELAIQYERFKREVHEMRTQISTLKWVVATLSVLLLALLGVLLFGLRRHKGLRAQLGKIVEQTDAMHNKALKDKASIATLQQENDALTYALQDLQTKYETLTSGLARDATIRNGKQAKAILELAAEGRYTLTTSDWNAIYRIVDSEDPTYADKADKMFSRQSERNRRVAYMHAFGLNAQQIANIDGRVTSTIWRMIGKTRGDKSIVE
ncbi:MAG: hypothetical protein J6N92_07215 [Alloprevotella sp.]|nr:hypothetical protein [Alloprevotella sp.]